MKLLVSDYDDTFYTNRLNIQLNIEKIHEFMSSGNLFAIATARSFRSAKMAVREHQIPYNYLICMDGAITYDKNDDIIEEHIFSEQESKTIDEIIYNYPKAKIPSFHTTKPTTNDVVCYSIVSPYSKELIQTLKDKVPDIAAKGEKMHFFLYKTLMNKGIAITNLINLLEIDKNDVFTIGDGPNDLEMIRDFNGFRIINHHQALGNVGLDTYHSVYELVDDIMKGTSKTKRK